MIDVKKEEKLRISFIGRLDATNAPEAMQKVSEALKGLERDILLDLTFMKEV